MRSGRLAQAACVSFEVNFNFDVYSQLGAIILLLFCLPLALVLAFNLLFVKMVEQRNEIAADITRFTHIAQHFT